MPARGAHPPAPARVDALQAGREQPEAAFARLPADHTRAHGAQLEHHLAAHAGVADRVCGGGVALGEQLRAQRAHRRTAREMRGVAPHQRVKRAEHHLRVARPREAPGAVAQHGVLARVALGAELARAAAPAARADA